MRRNKGNAQTFLEYAVLIGVVAAALVAMRVYMVRAVQEKYRQSADVFGEGEQYAKGITQVTNLDEPGKDIPEPEPKRPDTCPGVTANVARLEGEIKDLQEQADSMLASAAQTEASLPMLQQHVDALTAQAAQKETQARDLRKQALELTAQADDKQKQVDNYKKDYPDCFTGSGFEEGSFCYDLQATVGQLENEISSLHSQADSMNTQAVGLENEAKDLRAQAESLNGSILKLKEQISNLRAQADDFKTKIDNKQADIDRYKKDYPDCFKS